MAITKVTTIEELINVLNTQGTTELSLANNINLNGNKISAPFTGFTIDAGTYSIIASADSSISGFNIVSAADAAIIVTGDNVSVTNNTITTSGTAVKSDSGVADLTVTGNKITSSGTSNVIDISNASGKLTVDNNTIACSNIPMGVVISDSTAAISVSGNAISYSVAKSGEAIAITAPKAASISTEANTVSNLAAAPALSAAAPAFMLASVGANSVTSIKVNYSWVGRTEGDEVEPGYIYGTNAFSNINNALAAAADATTDTTITLESSIFEPLTTDYYIGHNLTINSADPSYTLNLGTATLAIIAKNGATVKLDESLHVTYAGQLFGGYNNDTGYETAQSTLTFDGKVDNVTQIWVYYGGTVNVNKTAQVYLGNGDGMLKMRYDSTLNVTGSLTTTDVDLATTTKQLSGGYVSGDYNGAKVINLKNTYMSTSWITNSGTGSFTVNADNSILNITTSNVNLGTDAAGAINLSNGSRFIIAKTLTLDANDTMSIADSSVSATTVTNAGTVNVSGTSKLSATSFAGNLNLGKVGTATTLTTDGLTFDNSAACRTIYITDGSTVTLSGSGFDFDEQSEDGVNIRNSATERSGEAHTGHTLNLNNLTLTADQTFHSIYTNSGSTVNFSGSTIATTSNGTYLNTYGGTLNVKDNSDISTGWAKITGEQNVTGEGTKFSAFNVDLFVAPTGYHAGILNVTNGATMSVVYTVEVNEAAKDVENYATGGSANASLNVTNATLTAGSLTNNAGGTVNLNNGTLTVTAAFSNAGTINLAGNTGFITTGSFSNTGTISVDATNFATNGVYKLVDVTGSTTATYGTYEFAEGKTKAGYTLTVVDNDLYAMNVDLSTIKVNAAWSTAAYGEEVATGYFYGINAFSGINAALANVAATTTTITLESSIDEQLTKEYGIGHDLLINSADPSYTLNLGTGTAGAITARNGATVTLDESLHVTKSPQFFGGDNNDAGYETAQSTFAIDGKVDDAYQIWVFKGGTVNINKTAQVKMNTTDGMLKMRYDGTLNVTGNLTTTDVDLTTTTKQLSGGYVSGDYNGNKVINLTNAYMSTSWITNSGTGSFTVNADNSILRIQHDGSTGVSFGADAAGAVNLSNGSRFIIDNAGLTLDANDTMSIADSSVSATTITNNGTVNVTGTSKLSASTFTGNINVGSTAAATTLTTDGLTTTGSVYVTDDSTVTLSGDGFSFGGMFRDSVEDYNVGTHKGYTLNVKDADAFHTYGFYVNGDSTVNVTNVEDLDTVYFNVYGGTMNVTGTDKASYSAYAKENFNVTGTLNFSGVSATAATLVVYAGVTGKQGGSLTADNTTVKARFVRVGNETTDAKKYLTDGTETASFTLNNSTLQVNNIGGEGASTLKVGSATTAGVLTLNNSNITYNLTVGTAANMTIAANSSVVMTGISSIAVTSVTNSGTITVDAMSFTAAAYKLIDVSAASDFGTYKFATGKDNGYEFITIDNDLYAYDGKISLATIQVNSEWADYTFGQKVTVSDVDYYYGINAFSNLTSAVAAAKASDTTTINIASGTGTYADDNDVDIRKSVALVIDANGVVVKPTGSGFTFYTNSADATYSISGGKLTLASIWNGAQTNYTETLNINNEIFFGAASETAADREIWNRDGIINFNNGANVYGLDQIANRGTININKGATVTVSSYQGSGGVELAGLSDRGGAMTIEGVLQEADGGVWTENKTATVAQDNQTGTVSIQNGGKLIFAKQILDVGAKGTVTVKDGGSATLKGINNAGTITVSSTTKDKIGSITAGTITNAGSINITGASTVTTTGAVTNSGKLSVGAEATFTVNGDMTNTGSFSFVNATVTGNYESANLSIGSGMTLTAGTISVTNLTMAIGGKLNLGTGTSTPVTSFTVTGSIGGGVVYALATNWKSTYATTITYEGKTYTWSEDDDAYTNADTEYVFALDDDKILSAMKVSTDYTDIYIGSKAVGVKTGDSITVGGKTYIVGTTAFAKASDVPDATKALVTSLSVTDNTTIDATATGLTKLESLSVEKGTTNENTINSTVALKGATTSTLNVATGVTLTGASTATYDLTAVNDLAINNYGTLDIDAEAKGDMAIINTSVHTLNGSYTGKDVSINNTGAMSNVTVTAEFNAEIYGGGTATGMTINAAQLFMGGSTVEITDKNSTILSDNGIIHLQYANATDFPETVTAGAKLTLKGSGSWTIDSVIEGAYYDANNNVQYAGDVILTGGQKTLSANAAIAADNIIIDNTEAYFNTANVLFNTLTVNGSLTADFDKINAFSNGGKIAGAGQIYSTHTGEWIVNDSVAYDFQLGDFAGTVTMNDSTASITMGLGDAPVTPALAAKDSYFGDKATVVIGANQAVNLKGADVTTGIKFAEDGILNVFENQTLTGDSSGFTGLTTVSEGKTLTLQNAFNAVSITLDKEDDTAVTTLALDKKGLDIVATVSGDANDIVDVKQDATLSTANAIKDFKGTVAVNSSTLTLSQANETSAKLTGNYDANVTANANQTLSAAAALNGFHGTVTLGTNTLALSDVNITEAKFSGTNSAVIDANAGLTLTADAALNGFSGTVAMEDNALTLGGVNTTSAKFTSNDPARISAYADQTFNANDALTGFSGTFYLSTNTTLTLNGTNKTNAWLYFDGSEFNATVDANADLELTRGAALNAFYGIMDIGTSTLTLGDINTTKAKFKSDAGKGKIDANAEQTLSTTGALDDFHGTVDSGANVLILSGANTTDAKFTGTGAIVSVAADANQTLSATGAINSFSGTVILEGNTLTLDGINDTGATFTGTNTAVIDANAAQTLSADAALNDFSGTVALDTNDLTLGGINTTDALFTGTSASTITANADQTLKAATALDGFTGTVAMGANALTLGGTNSTDALFTGTSASTITANADQALKAATALDGFTGTVAMGTNALTLGGINTTSALFTGASASTITANADQTLKAATALDGFTGTVAMGANTLTLGGINTTSATFTGTSVSKIVANANQTFSGINSGFLGTADVAEGKTLTLQGNFGGNVNLNKDQDTASTILVLDSANLVFGGTVTGDNGGETATNADKIDVKKSATMAAEAALDNFLGTVALSTNTALTLSKANDTGAKFTGTNTAVVTAGANLTLSSNDAISAFNGTMALGTNTLTLEGTNTTGATFTGGTDSKIVANANQTLGSGSMYSSFLSEFSGTIDAANDSTVTINGNVDSLTLNLKGNQVDLTFGLKSTGVTVNAKDSLTTLNANAADVTLATGTVTNVTSSTGDIALTGATVDSVTSTSGDIDLTGWTVDRTLDTLTTGGTTSITSAYDVTVTNSLSTNLAYSINGTQTAVADLTYSKASAFDFNKSMSVTVDTSDRISSSPYKLLTANKGLTMTTNYITLTISDVATEGTKQVYVDNGAKIGEKIYFLYNNGTTLSLSAYDADPTFVCVNESWTAAPYATVEDNFYNDPTCYTDRHVGYDAAASIDDAITYIKGDDDGAATIELTENKTYAISTALGTTGDDGNGVTNMTLQARSNNPTSVYNARISGNINAGAATTLNLVRLTVAGNVLGNGAVNIYNSAINRISGTYIAANGALTIRGGIYTSRYIAGGYAATAAVTAAPATNVTIKGLGEERTSFSGSIYGGYIANGVAVTQENDASVTIDATNKIVISGSIYAGGAQLSAAGSSLSMTGNRTVTFTGDGDNLGFIGTVSGGAQGTTLTAGQANLVFTDFTGRFDGSITEFGNVTIKGNSALTLRRAQSKVSETNLTFTVTSATTAGTAMYTVRDANKWEFAKNITVGVEGITASGTYTLIDNYAAGFSGFSFTIGSKTQTWTAETTSLSFADGAFVLNYTTETKKLTLTVDDKLFSTFLVDTAYAAKDPGTTVTSGGKDYYVGVNAFGDLDSVAAALTTATTNVIVNSDVSGTAMSWAMGRSVTTDNANGVTITDSDPANWNYIGYGTIGAGVTLKSEYISVCEKNETTGGTVTIDGIADASGQFYQGYDTVVNVSATGEVYSRGSELVVRKNTTADKGIFITGNDNTKLQLSASFVNFYSGTISLKNTKANFGTKIQIRRVSDGAEYAAPVLTMDNSSVTVGKLSMINTASSTLDCNGIVNVLNGSTFTVTGGGSSLDASNTLNVTNSTVSITGTLTNAGTINITVGANSSFTITSLTNNGTIMVDMSNATETSYTLIDAAAASTYGTYDFVEGKANGYTLSVVGNDLIATKVPEVKLASAAAPLSLDWDEDTTTLSDDLFASSEDIKLQEDINLLNTISAADSMASSDILDSQDSDKLVDLKAGKLA